MPTFMILALVCSVGTAKPDCTPDTAVDMVKGPKVAGELLCGLQGQTMMAGAVAPRPDLEYLKVVCVRKK